MAGADWEALGIEEPTFKANIGNLVWIRWSDLLESRRRNPRIAVTLALRARVVNTSNLRSTAKYRPARGH